MGEAKRKKLHQLPPAVTVDQQKFAAALRLVGCAITDMPCADCALYALIGAAAFNRLGLPAKACAGSASWRVGPGDGDVISHAPESISQHYAPVGAKQSAIFHAWIEVGAGETTVLIDPTTWQLPKKANELDALDGQTTTIVFAPDFIWLPKKEAERLSLKEVAQSYDTGVFSYVRKKDVESIVFTTVMRSNLEEYIEPVLRCYNLLLKGENVVVYGMDEHGVSEEKGPQFSPFQP